MLTFTNVANPLCMLYALVRPIVTAGFYAYFGKIYLLHADRIPRDKPVILASNHPTGFMEPCIAACFLDRPLYFLVRGDFFARNVYARLLRALHMLPVFRWKDGGYRKLKDNFATFEACHDALHDHLAIMIFVEGSTEYVRRQRPLQKGAARIAFGALERYPEMEDVYIVPVGATYEAAHRWRSQVILNCGAPVRVRPYLAQYEENAGEAISQLTGAVAAGLRTAMVHVEQPENDELVDWLLRMDANEHPARPLPTLSADEAPLARGRALARAVDALDDAQRRALQEQLADHFADLERRGLFDRDLGPHPRFHLGHYLLLALGAPPALAGYLFNLPPWALSRWIADTQVKSIEFYGPVKFAVGIGLALFYFLFFFLLAGIQWGLTGVLAVLGFLLLGFFAVWYGDWCRRWQSKRRFDRLSPEEQRALRGRRREILEGAGAVVG